MTDKITLATVSELQTFPSAAAAINSNSAIITAAMDNTLSRDGTSPNQMEAALDMNSNRIVNLPAPSTLLEPVRMTDLNTIINGGTIVVEPLPTGGTTGQVLEKNSNTDFDTKWATIDIPATGVLSIAGNTGAFTLGSGLTNSTNVLKVNAGHIPGDTSGNPAAAGEIGELIFQNVPSSSFVTMSNGAASNIAQITLTPGDWDVSGAVVFSAQGSTNYTEMHVGTSLTSGALETSPSQGSTQAFHVQFLVGQSAILNSGPRQLLISVPTTIYLVAVSTVASGSPMLAYGYIRARRMR